MATYYVDDGGDGTTESSWATADTSINNLDAEYGFASGDIVYFGHDMQCQATNSAHLTIAGPAASPPILFISATQGSSPPAYAASTTKQIDTTEGAYRIIFDGSFALFGMSMASGADIRIDSDGNEPFYAEWCRFAMSANSTMYFSVTPGNECAAVLRNCVIDLTADLTTNRTGAVFGTASAGISMDFFGLSFINPGYRTGVIVDPTGGLGTEVKLTGCDFSGFPSSCEIVNGQTNSGKVIASNCLTGATWTPSDGITQGSNNIFFTNCGPANAPTYLFNRTYFGDVVSSASIYRAGGATIESANVGWLITTTAASSESVPLRTPWIYGSVGSAGSKTFDVYITNDTADFTDADVWLEVEYLGTASEAQTALANDHRTITTTAAAQTDDTASTWNGSGPSFTYKQKLSATATVNQTGQFRARVCVGLASIASSRYFYVDPAVTVG